MNTKFVIRKGNVSSDLACKENVEKNYNGKTLTLKIKGKRPTR
jgi:hypothetical protein